MQAIQIRCPNCGAIVDAAGDSDGVRCQYCGTASRVQRRSRVLQIPLRPPASGPPAIARQVRRAGTRAGRILGAVIVSAVAAGVIASGVVISRAVHRTMSGRLGWNGLGPPIVVDVDGDGTDDVVGLARNVQAGDSMYLAAYSGKDGTGLWMTGRLGSYSEVYQGRVALAGTTILWADPRANLHAYALATGAPRWTRSAGEKVVSFCAGDTDAQIAIATADERWTTVTLADGAMTAGPRRRDRAHGHGRPDRDAPPPCRALATDLDKSVADTDVTDVFGDLPAVDGMNVQLALQRAGGAPVVLGTRAPGSAVPMVAVIDERGHARWKSEVPASDPLAARLAAPELAAVGDRDVVIVWEHQDGPPSLTSFDVATGARRWEARLAKDHATVLTGVAISRTAVMVSTWGALQVFDRESGQPRFIIGALL